MDLRQRLHPDTLDPLLERLGLDEVDRPVVLGWAEDLDEDDLGRLVVLVGRLDQAFGSYLAGTPMPVFEPSDTDHRLGRGALVVLACALAADALAARSSYPDDVVRLTQADLGQQVRKHRDRHGATGLDVAWWMERVMADGFARLGRLQFEVARSDLGHGAYGEVPVLSVHVPADGPLDPDAVDDSLVRAATFFEQHHPGLGPVDWFVCHSWLLDPAVATLVPGGNIAAFCQRFDVWRATPDDAGCLLFAFDVPTADGEPAPGDLSRLDTSTRLRRALVQHWASGEHVMSCWGSIPVIRSIDDTQEDA